MRVCNEARVYSAIRCLLHAIPICTDIITVVLYNNYVYIVISILILVLYSIILMYTYSGCKQDRSAATQGRAKYCGRLCEVSQYAVRRNICEDKAGRARSILLTREAHPETGTCVYAKLHVSKNYNLIFIFLLYRFDNLYRYDNLTLN